MSVSDSFTRSFDSDEVGGERKERQGEPSSCSLSKEPSLEGNDSVVRIGGTLESGVPFTGARPGEKNEGAAWLVVGSNSREIVEHRVAMAVTRRGTGTFLLCFLVLVILTQYLSLSIFRSSFRKDAPLEELDRAIETCELPSCDLVVQSRMYSKRCNTEEAKWPLLVTGTPRSATTYTAFELSAYGLEIAHDWRQTPSADGASSWIFAVEDEESYGPEKTDGYKFKQVCAPSLHLQAHLLY